MAAVPVSTRGPCPTFPSDVAKKGKAPVDPSKRGGEYFRINVEIPMEASALKSKDQAEELFRMIFLPRDMELRGERSLEELAKSFYPGLMKVRTLIRILVFVSD